MALPKITLGTVVKLVIASLCVGLVLAWLDMDPIELFAWARDRIEGALGDATEWVLWSAKYILLGAVIVVPIWLLSYLWRAARKKS